MCMLKYPYVIFLEIKSICNTSFLLSKRSLKKLGSMKYWLSNENFTLIKMNDQLVTEA